MKALLYLAPGFEEIEAITTIDILRRADIDTETVSITNQLQVIGAHDIEVKADILFESTKHKEADILILPGGMPGSKNLAEHKGLNEVIKQHHEAKKWLAAICAAPLVYGRMGLLEGQEAICYPSFEAELKGAKISEDVVVTSGNFITGKGPGVTMEFALEIVKQLKDDACAQQIAQDLIKQ